LHGSFACDSFGLRCPRFIAVAVWLLGCWFTSFRPFYVRTFVHLRALLCHSPQHVPMRLDWITFGLYWVYAAAGVWLLPWCVGRFMGSAATLHVGCGLRSRWILVGLRLWTFTLRSGFTVLYALPFRCVPRSVVPDCDLCRFPLSALRCHAVYALRCLADFCYYRYVGITAPAVSRVPYALLRSLLLRSPPLRRALVSLLLALQFVYARPCFATDGACCPRV